LFPALEMTVDGEAPPLIILLSENSWEAGGQVGAAAEGGAAGPSHPTTVKGAEAVLPKGSEAVFVKLPHCVGITTMSALNDCDVPGDAWQLIKTVCPITVTVQLNPSAVNTGAHVTVSPELEVRC
jgi:hypothetical protein